MKSSSISAVATLFAPAIAATTSKCLGDNVYRCLVSSSVFASPYCSSILSSPATTATVTVTVTTVTPTAIVTINAISTATATSTSTAIITSSSSVPGFAKRAKSSKVSTNNALHHADVTLTARAVATSPAPKCLMQVSSTIYPASRISSACSCLPAPTSTKYVTATASTTVTSTVVSSTAFTTLMATTSTTSNIGIMAACPTILDSPSPTDSYQQYYKGSGFTENFNNPGNNVPDASPPQTTTFPGTMEACTVLQRYTNWSNRLGEYDSFDLHYLGSQGVYEYTAFFNSNDDPSYFNVENADVVSGVGYYVF